MSRGPCACSEYAPGYCGTPVPVWGPLHEPWFPLHLPTHPSASLGSLWRLNGRMRQVRMEHIGGCRRHPVGDITSQQHGKGLKATLLHCTPFVAPAGTADSANPSSKRCIWACYWETGHDDPTCIPAEGIRGVSQLL